MPPEWREEEDGIRSLWVELPWKTVKSERLKFVRKAGKTLVLPGFRKGKVPLVHLFRELHDDILIHLARGLIRTAAQRESRSLNWNVAAGPFVETISMDESLPLRAGVKFVVYPEFELADYRGLPVEVPVVTVSDEDIAARLEDIRRRHATFISVDPRPIRNGDTVLCSLKGFGEGPEPEVALDETQVNVGHPETKKEFSTALLGLQPGDRKQTEVTYSEDSAPPKLKGRTLSFSIEVHQILRAELPELDDDLARDVSEQLATLDDLKTQLRIRLTEQLRREVSYMAASQVQNALALGHPMTLPSSVVAARVDNLVRQQGVDRADLSGEQLADLERTADVQIRVGLVLDRISQIEGIKLEEEELRRIAVEVGRSTPQPSGPDSGVVLDQQRAAELLTTRVREKTIDFLLEQASVTEREPDGSRSMNPKAAEEAEGDVPEGPESRVAESMDRSGSQPARAGEQG